MADKPRLSVLASDREVNSGTSWIAAARTLDVGRVAEMYSADRKNAPRRHDRKPPKVYFVDGHDGIPSTGTHTNRLEEHLALALWAEGSLPGTGTSGPLRLVDYQVPLKAANSDRGVGKIDLFGVTSVGLPVVVELKVAGAGNATSDTPLRALIEGLGYAAIVESNMEAFASELAERFNIEVSDDKPGLLVAGPRSYWQQWTDRSSGTEWKHAISETIAALSRALGIDIEMWDLGKIGVEPGLNETRPRLLGAPSVKAIC